MLKSHLNLFHALKLSINFYNMNEVLYLKSVKIIAKIKLNGKENKSKMWEVIFKLRAVSIRSYKAAWWYDTLVFLYLSILANAREGLTFMNMLKDLTHQLCLQQQGTGNPASADLNKKVLILSQVTRSSPDIVHSLAQYIIFFPSGICPQISTRQNSEIMSVALWPHPGEKPPFLSACLLYVKRSFPSHFSRFSSQTLLICPHLYNSFTGETRTT